MAAPVRTAPPLYIKHSQIGFLKDYINYYLCNAMNRVVRDCAVCAQQIRGLWILYAKNEFQRTKILHDGLTFGRVRVTVYDANPFLNNAGQETLSEKVVIRDVPFHMANEDIITYFRQQHPHIHLKSAVLCTKIIDEYQNYTNMYNGDRHIYVEAGFTPALPKTTRISGVNCRLWHRDQKNRCRRCSADGHIWTEYNKCDWYIPEGSQNLDIFQAASDPRSNYYDNGKGFNIVHDDELIRCRTGEHAYQFLKCVILEHVELARSVLRAPTAAAAKNLVKQIPIDDQVWNKEKKLKVMNHVLRSKAVGCREFREKIIESGTKLMVEAGSHTFWACGLQHVTAITTKKDKFPGENQLGICLMELRVSMMEDIIHDVDNTNENPPRNNGQGPNTNDGHHVQQNNNATGGPQQHGANNSGTDDMGTQLEPQNRDHNDTNAETGSTHSSENEDHSGNGTEAEADVSSTGSQSQGEDHSDSGDDSEGPHQLHGVDHSDSDTGTGGPHPSHGEDHSEINIPTKTTPPINDQHIVQEKHIMTNNTGANTGTNGQYTLVEKKKTNKKKRLRAIGHLSNIPKKGHISNKANHVQTIDKMWTRAQTRKETPDHMRISEIHGELDNAAPPGVSEAAAVSGSRDGSGNVT